MSEKNYKCINCGSDIAFIPDKDNWKCESCMSEFTLSELEDFFDVNDDKENEDPFSREGNLEMEEIVNEGDIDQDVLNSYNCQNCGGELVTDNETVATFCPYCKSSTIIKSKLKGKFRPGLLIPFKKTEDEAKEIYHNWVKKKIFTPKKFKSKKTIDEIKGLYAPYWLYDVDIDGNIRGDAQNVKTWTSGDYEYTQTDYYRVERGGRNAYEKVPADASLKLDDDLMERIEPFDYSDITNFNMAYMAGFFAENYDVSSEEALSVVKKKASEYFEERLRDTISRYDYVSITRRDFALNNIKYTYSMLPIYYVSNSFKDKQREFIINGQTGKISGNPPKSGLIIAGYAVLFYLASLLVLGLGGALIV